MSVGVSSNTSPGGHPQYQHQHRGDEYFSSSAEDESRRGYDTIRSSQASGNNLPLLRRIIHQDPLSQRRHSIANMNSLSTTINDKHSKKINSFYYSNLLITHALFLEKTPNIYQFNQEQKHQQRQYHNHLPNPLFPGHYSAPSSPPMHHTHQKLNAKHQQLPPPFSPYSNKRLSKGNSFNMGDDMSPPPPQQIRRNSSALVYRGGSSHINRESLASRRMSSSALVWINNYMLVTPMSNSLFLTITEPDEPNWEFN